MTKTAHEIIDALGGYRVVAERLKLEPQTVHNWTRRGIAARFWPEIVEFAEETKVTGVTFDDLRAARALAAPGRLAAQSKAAA